MSIARSLNAKSWHLGFVVGFALFSPAAFAEDAPPPEARAVVADQLDAFERGDAGLAWRLSAPEVRQRFTAATEFADMVKSKYGPIYRHRSVDFGPAARRGDEVGMVVTIVDDDNEVWSAIFVLSKQSDGAWRTSGCMLAKAPEKSV